MRPKPVIPREAATRDIEGAVDYYLGEQAWKAASGIVSALQEAFELIGRSPKVGSPRLAIELDLSGLRSWPLRRYPYIVCYRELDEVVDVWRVLHAERDIPSWLME